MEIEENRSITGNKLKVIVSRMTGTPLKCTLNSIILWFRARNCIQANSLNGPEIHRMVAYYLLWSVRIVNVWAC